jgi:hypothetical protein
MSSDGRTVNRRVLRVLLLPFAGFALAVGLASVSQPAQAITDTTSIEGAVAFWEGDRLSAFPVSGHDGPGAIDPSDVLTYYVYLPLIFSPGTCQPIPGESYGTLPVNPPPTDRPAEVHPDLNLALRGYELTDAFKGLVGYNGAGDPIAPQLPGLFADSRTGTFSEVYRVYDWNWGCNCRGDLISDWAVTLAGLVVTPGETIHVPNSGYTIGSGYEVLVLYASTDRITLKYTRDDNVVSGYTIHVEDVCVEPSLLALYHASNSAGRGQLPALRAGQALGRARGNEIGVVIRDNGRFMDPRSQKDWWQGR